VVTTDANGNLAHILVSNLIPAVTTPCQELVAGALQCGTNAQAVANQSTALGQASTASGTSSTAVGFLASASADNSSAFGKGSTASAANSSSFGAGAQATSPGGTALGFGANASAPNSVAIGSGSIANAPNTVSVGTAGNERRITNVAAGISPTDAVNVGQLSSVAAGVQSLSTQLNNVDRRLRDGVAISMAAGGVPSVPQGRRVGVFGNLATYDGHGAAGFGITGVLYETRSYQVQANGAVGVGFDTSVVGARGGVGVFW
jgi:autotransporter adhesin